MRENTPIAVDLFCGAGGLSVGVERAGFTVILANEIETDFAATYSVNHPGAKTIAADIHNIDFAEEVRKLGCGGTVDLVCGGPPCQGFSTVGKKDYRDPRNSLFWEFLRAVREIAPRFVLFENVSGFKRLYEGEAYETLIRELDKMGYRTNAAVLEASDYGLPQKRQRTIVIGWSDPDLWLTFPMKTHGEMSLIHATQPKRTLMDAISDLPPIESGGSADFYLTSPRNNYQRFLRGDATVLTEHCAANYGSKMQEILSLVPPGGTVNDLPLRLRPKNYFGNTYARLLPNEPSPTVTRNFGTPSSSRCIHPFQNRALSTREGARLQGFPDGYVFHGNKTSKNLQIGNAVPPIFGEIIARAIIDKTMVVSGKGAVEKNAERELVAAAIR